MPLAIVVLVFVVFLFFSSFVVALGEDKELPTISYRTFPKYFSPDGDGVDDTTTIRVESAEEVIWEIRITRPNQLVHARYTGKGYTFAAEWNGQSNLLNSTVPSAGYIIYIYATDSSGNTVLDSDWVDVVNSSTPASVLEELEAPFKDSDHDGLKDEAEKTRGTDPGLADTDSDGYNDGEDSEPLNNAANGRPVLSNVSISLPVFSPNNDGVEDVVTISAEASEDSEWDVDIKNHQGEVVQKLAKKKSRSFSVSWNGFSRELKDNVRDGKYTVEIVAQGGRDLARAIIKLEVAGSQTISKSLSEKAPPTVSNIKAFPSQFSPNGDGVDDSVIISAEASEEIAEWLISIVNVEDKEAYEKMWGMKGKNLRIEWNGISNSLGGPVPNGKYIIRIYANGEGGVAEHSIPIEVFDSPNKNGSKIGQIKIPRKRMEEAPSGITIPEVSLPGVIKRGEISRGSLTFKNEKNTVRNVTLTISLLPHSTSVSVSPDTVVLSIPPESTIDQDFQILPEEWAEAREYRLDLRLLEGEDDVYYGAMPIKISEAVQRPKVKISSETLVVVRSDIQVDFVSAQSYAVPNNAPIVKLNKEGLTEEDLNKLKGHIDSGVRKAVIVGGPVAVPFSIEYKLRELGFSVERIGGADRFETASMIAQLWGKVDIAVLGNGETETAYLDAYQLASTNKAPLLLTRPNSLSESIIDALKTLGVKKIILGRSIEGSITAKLAEIGVEVG